MSLDLNPEFQRNLWLHLGWQRMMAAATVGLTVAYAVLLVSDFDKLSYAANLILVMVLGMWGPRRAADTLAEEVAGGTWESQRMSGLSAWSMAWGKLIGGCSFVWYCGLLALAVYVFAGFERGFPPGRAGNFWLGIYLVLIGACLAHVVALGVALIRLRKTVQYRRLTITLAQTCGFVVFLAVSGIGTAPVLNQPDFVPGTAYVFDSAYSWPMVRAVLGSVFVVWALVAVYRLMRAELQYRAWPWFWASFVAFCAALAAGIAPWPGGGMVGAALPIFIVMIALTYLSALADRRDPIRYRSGLLALRHGDFSRALAEIPWWSIAMAGATIAALFAIYTLVTLGSDGWPSSLSEIFLRLRLISLDHLAETLVLVLLFMTRDLAILLWLSFGPWRSQSDVTWLVYLALVYWPVSIIMIFAGYGAYITLVLPVAGDDIVLSFAPILTQLVVLGVMLHRRWRQATRSGVAA
ncbi:hypothetical protein [Dongia rigui]|uniref:Uncharacterized protein n=1 Tax=Dongia rigui TaxID=940149 RepID=A0ABU5E190_9PROT|nr:hypothetical protein [Dongia rigui]MDY0873279.1 hypothetical protein [Dongia rigui]